MKHRRNGSLGSIIQQQMQAPTFEEGASYAVHDGDEDQQAQTSLHTSTSPVDMSSMQAFDPSGSSLVRGSGGGGSSTPSSGGGADAPPPSADQAPYVPDMVAPGSGGPSADELPPGFNPPADEGSSALPPETGVYDDTAPWLKQVKQLGREFIDPRGQIGPLPTWGWWLIIAGSAGALWYWRAS